MKLIVLFFSLMLSACSNHEVSNYSNENPKLDLREFFNGKIYAHGVVQDRKGKVINRFVVDITGSWKNNELTLDEKFTYSDNSKSARVWSLKEVSPFKYEGRAHDVIGIAHGEVSGNAFYFQYNLDLPVGKKTYNIHFEDWMYLLDKDTLMARSYMKKWGFRVGEVTIFMSKKDLK